MMRTIHVLTLAGALAASFGAAGCGGAKCGDEGTVCSIVGTGSAGLDQGEGTPGLESAVYLPQDITWGPDGLMYIVDWNNHRIRVWDPATDTVTTVAGTGVTADGPEGPALDTGLNHPTNLAFDGSGGLLIAAWHNSRLKRVDLSAGTIEHICGNGMRTFSGDEGPAEMAGLDLPVGVVVSSNGDIYFMDQANNRIRYVDAAGIIHTYAGSGLGTGINMMTMMPNPECVGAAPSGVEDCFLDGDLLMATFNNPRGQAAPPAGRIAIDGDDNIYVADTANNAIRRIDFAAGTISTIAGLGPTEDGFSGDGGPAVEARLDFPTDLAIGPDGTIYIADTHNSCIRAIDPSGTISTAAGVCTTDGTSDEATDRAEALLDHPYGVDVGPDGNLYIADTENNFIKVVYFNAAE